MKALKSNFKKWLDDGCGDEWLSTHLSNREALNILIKTIVISVLIIMLLNILTWKI